MYWYIGGVEFNNTGWDMELAMELMPVWSSRGYLSGSLMDVEHLLAVIDAAGYGANFTHRTGHNIGQETHGNGANMDNLETHEERRVLPRTCFSIEPGIYLPGRHGARIPFLIAQRPCGDHRISYIGVDFTTVIDDLAIGGGGNVYMPYTLGGETVEVEVCVTVEV